MAENVDIHSPIRVMISDDHPIVRQGLRMMMEAYPDLEVVAEAGDGEQAVRLAAETQPDVLVIDLQMPLKDGITAIQEITQANPAARILVLTSFPEDDNVFRAIKAGALGYVLKETAPEQLVESIRAIQRGEVALHPVIARKLVKEIRQPEEVRLKGEPLTPRELDVLKRLARGLTNQEIAEELSVSVRTVTTHVRSILDKLRLANRTQAALYAVEQGIADKPVL
jgi:NarL family two-component system response regulator LiaR